MSTDLQELEGLRQALRNMLQEVNIERLSPAEMWDRLGAPLSRNAIWLTQKVELRQTRIRVESTFTSANGEWDTVGLAGEEPLEVGRPIGATILRLQLQNVVDLIHYLAIQSEQVPGLRPR